MSIIGRECTTTISQDISRGTVKRYLRRDRSHAKGERHLCINRMEGTRDLPARNRDGPNKNCRTYNKVNILSLAQAIPRTFDPYCSELRPNGPYVLIIGIISDLKKGWRSIELLAARVHSGFNREMPLSY